jgi:hypothetical protein
LVSRQAGITTSFDTLPQNVTVVLILAAWIRLGLIPIQTPQFQEYSVRRNLGTLASLVSAASSLVLLVRASNVGVLSWQVPYWLILSGIVAFYGSFSWYFSPNELQGRPYWIIALSAFSVAAAIRAQQPASLAWSLTLLLTGGVLFLYSTRRGFLILLPVLGLVNLIILPATLSWNGATLFSSPFNLAFMFFLLAQALLLAGYYRLTRNEGEPLIEAERWVWLVYTLGLGVIALFQVPLAWMINFSDRSWLTPINLSTLWPGLAILSLAAIILLLSNRGWRLSPRSQTRIRVVFSLSWFYRFVGYVYQFIGRIISIFTFVLEGEGGVLWVLLWLALLYVVISQGYLGGI